VHLSTTIALAANQAPTHWWGLIVAAVVIAAAAWVAGAGRPLRGSNPRQ